MIAYSNRATRAFSMIELMIVIVIMAVLAAIILPMFTDHTRRSKESGLHYTLSQIRTAVATFQADTDSYPKQLSDLSSTTAPAQGYNSLGTLQNITPADWHGPYVGSLPMDTISGTPLTYKVTAPGVGTVTSSASGNDISGVAFSTY